MDGSIVIGLGTAVLLLIIAGLLWRARFGRWERHGGAGDPATVWLRGDRSETPPSRDSASVPGADDPTGKGNGDSDSPEGEGGSDGP